MVNDVVPDLAVDIPLIWQYIGEILGAFIGGPSPNMSLLKPILQIVPSEKSQQLFKNIIRFAIELSVNFDVFQCNNNTFFYFSQNHVYKNFGNYPVFH